MDEHFKPLLDSLLMALESLQQRLASKVNAEEGEETTQFNASFGFCDLQNYKTTMEKTGLDLVCLKTKNLENLNTTEYSRLLLYLSNPNHKQAT